MWPWGWGCVCNSLWGVEGRNKNQNANTKPGCRDEWEAGSRRGHGCRPQLRGGGAQCTDVPLRCHLPSPCPSSTPSGRSAGLGPTPNPHPIPLPRRKKRPFSPQTSQRADAVLSASCSAFTQQPHPLGLPPWAVDVVRGLAVKARLRHLGPCGPSQSPPTSLSSHFPPLVRPVSPGHWEVGMTPCT